MESQFLPPKITLSMRVGHVIPPTHFGHDRHTSNFKLSQQTSYGRIASLATDAGTISDM